MHILSFYYYFFRLDHCTLARITIAITFADSIVIASIPFSILFVMLHILHSLPFYVYQFLILRIVSRLLLVIWPTAHGFDPSKYFFCRVPGSFWVKRHGERGREKEINNSNYLELFIQVYLAGVLLSSEEILNLICFHNIFVSFLCLQSLLSLFIFFCLIVSFAVSLAFL